MNIITLFSGIRTRVLLNNLAFFCIVVGIIIIVLSSFMNVETSLTQIINRDVNAIIQNARLSRELATIFASTRSLMRESGIHGSALRRDGEALLAQLNKLIHDMPQDAPLREALRAFSEHFQTLIDQTVALTDAHLTIQALQRSLVETTRNLEYYIIQQQTFTLDADPGISAMLNTLQLTVARHRERILQIQLEFAAISQSFWTALAQAEEHTAYALLLTAIQELRASFQVLDVGDQEIVAYGTRLSHDASDYAAAIEDYQRVHQQTQASMTAMTTLQQTVLQRMHEIDAAIEQTALALQGNVKTEIGDSERMILILSVVFLIVVILGWWSVLRMIHPLQALAWCAEQLANGDLKTTIADIRTRDEIGRLSQAFQHLLSYFHDMAEAVTAISIGNLDLTVTPRSKHDALGTGFQRMIAYLNDMGQLSTRVAQGNLTGRITLHSQHDQLGKAFMQMQEGLIDLIREIRNRSDQLAAISQQVLHASNANSSALGHIGNAAEVTSSAMRQVSSSVDEVRVNTAHLSKSVEETSTSISEMIASITHVADNSRKLADFAENTRETMASIVHSLETVANQAEHSRQLAEGTSQDARYGQESVAQMTAKITLISEVTQRISTTVIRLETRSTEIGTILDVINDVADQTALLALNASIIAAQAGEHGRGFAVVAGEIKELANRVAASTKEIAGIVASVQKESAEAVEALSHGQREVEGGVLVAREAGDALQKIARSAQNSSEVAAEIAVLVRQQTTASNKVAASIHDVADMIKEIRGATQEQEHNSTQLFQVVETMQEMASQVARAMGEQQQSTVHVTDFMEDVITLVDENMSTVKQLGQSAHELAAQADVLKSQVQRFILP
jgi:methyl-accepting chemotaxis protein